MVYNIVSKPVVLRGMNKTYTNQLSCVDQAEVLGTLNPQISTSKTFMLFKANLRSNVQIHHAFLRFQLSGTSTSGITFAINLFKENIEGNTDCATYTGDLLDFGSLLTVHIQSTGGNAMTDIDIAPLVQRAVSKKDWGSKKTIILVMNAKRLGNEATESLFHDPSKCVLDIRFFDSFPSKSLIFFDGINSLMPWILSISD